LIATVAVLLFIGFDLALVVAALLWLSERRAQEDRTDARYRDRPARYR